MIPEKILIVQTAFLGDAVLTLPMIQFLKNSNKNALIDVIAIPSTADLFKASPAVRDVIVFDKRGKEKSFAGILRLSSLLRSNNYTAVYSPHRSFRSSLLVKLSRVKETFGFDISSWSFLYKTRIRYESDSHEVLRNLKLAGFVSRGEDDWKIIPEIKIDRDLSEKMQTRLSSLSEKKMAAIAPGSVWNTKVYPGEYFEKIAGYLISKGYFLLFMGGSSDKLLCDNLEQKFRGNSKSFAGEFSVVESVAALKNCTLIVSNDSAPTHLGAAADIPVLTLYCSTVPKFGFYPYLKGHYLSYDDLSCKPCGIHGHEICPIKTFDCAYKLTPEMVIRRIEEIGVLR